MGGQMLCELLRRNKCLDVIDGTVDPLCTIADASPDVAVIGVQLDHVSSNGFSLLQSIRSSSPKTRSVMMLDSPHQGSVVKAFRAGARGVFCRCDPLALLPKCIRRVHEGQIWANSQLIEFVIDALVEAPVCNLTSVAGKALLSSREQQVVRLAVEGLNNKEIGQALTLSEHTVRNYMFHIFNKLGVSNRVELVLYAASQRPSFVLHNASPENGIEARTDSYSAACAS